MTVVAGPTGRVMVDRLVEFAQHTLPDDPEVGKVLHQFYIHVDEADLENRRVEDLFGLAMDHLALAQQWSEGELVIDVANPKVELDGWGSDHTILRIVTDDIPFLVDSLSVELSRLGIGIHQVIHPVMPASMCRVEVDDEDHKLLSLISIEIDRQPLDDRSRSDLIGNIRRVLGDVQAAVRDWRPMGDRLRQVSASLTVDTVPFDEAEVAETRALLDWLADDHFLFLGARDYELDLEDGNEVLRLVQGSGLGILAGDTRLGRPRRLDELSPAARSRIHERRMLNITKAGSRATVHRASYLDYVGVKTFDEHGNVTGERRFLGLYTSELYNRSVTMIPRVRRTVAEAMEAAGFPTGGHDETRLRSILEQYPRDELLQMDAGELLDVALAIAGLAERRRVRAFVRTELFGRFRTVLVYLPRDRYRTEIRNGIEQLLLETYGGTLAEWDAEISDSVLARVRFLLRVEDQFPEQGATRLQESEEIESGVQTLIRVWEDDFAGALVGHFGQQAALELQRTYGEAFSPSYRHAFDPRTAAADVEHVDSLNEPGALRLNVYRRPGRPSNSFKLKLYRRGERVSLTSVMPSLTNLGVTVVDERPYEVRPTGCDPVWIYDFALEHAGLDLEFTEVSDLLEEAFSAVWSGSAEDDALNRLVLMAGLRASEVAVLRAYSHYLHQVRLPYSLAFVQQTLAEHPVVVRLLFELFRARFDPEADLDQTAQDEIEQRVLGAIDAIDSLDHDRILRRFHNAIGATLRTTWAQRDDEGQTRPSLCLKFDCGALDELPEPRPAYEIFVYSPRFEGVHLRAGAVARGGLRWSERSEDYRTEVLGLVKAQMVKNAVIIPVGAKGGFVLKHRTANPADLRQEVAECYRLFISGLLDITDNIVDGAIVAPPQTRRYDGDDPYLVVAADKGTATFSDLANEVAVSRGFWLGDAFASGGSNGYDHKGMGITARGAWESVKRHFLELGTDVQSQPFTTVGIGDMSGDVFGNGMLRSPVTRLIAAFDHRHIFIDPDPDPSTSYAERQRLFDIPRSSWDDYDRQLLSNGGGIFERSAKAIEVSPEAAEALGAQAGAMTPEQLIASILQAPVDLLWNGGIGTYVKANVESHADVGDKANDRIRVDASDLRCSVIGEGGNLGMTQLARVELASNGGRVFTDAIDNAAGVDCSDHEVNIKILLDQVVAEGDMTIKQRNELLEDMTDEVSTLVLDSNYRQSLALSAARIDAPSLIDVHGRYLDDLEGRGLIDRELEALPDNDAITDRRLAGRGLTTPEIAVLSAYTKNILSQEILDSEVADSPAFRPLLISYFPEPVREQFSHRLTSHQLRREIVANRVANLVVDRGGVSMIYRLCQETSAPSAELAAAHIAAWEIFQLEEIVAEANQLEGVLGVIQQLAIHLACRQLAERATRLLVRSRPTPFDPTTAIADLSAAVATTTAGLADALVGADRDAFETRVNELVANGAPEHLARRVAGLSSDPAALDIVAIASESADAAAEVSAAYFTIADRLDLTWLRDRILALPRDTQWSTLARLTLQTDLYSAHRDLTSLILAATPADADPVERLEEWIRTHRADVDRYRQTMVAIRSSTADVTPLLVATREVRNLMNRTTHR
ncbi:MAG: NAD-glutamate dehydrogenase [Actinomycetia bacterium]|nr:NAD-glutamate dehydrogenase [Actinomycetes bacterium]